jgi:hypothetical protein
MTAYCIESAFEYPPGRVTSDIRRESIISHLNALDLLRGCGDVRVRSHDGVLCHIPPPPRLSVPLCRPHGLLLVAQLHRQPRHLPLVSAMQSEQQLDSGSAEAEEWSLA